MSSWLSWVDRIYIYFTFHVLMTFMSWSYLYFFYISCPHDFHELIVFIFLLHFMSSWLSWVDRIFFYISLSSWLSWVDRISISFYISLSSWLPWVDRIYILFTFHCPHDSHEFIVFILIVLMICFNPSSSYLVALVI
jgi:hypothetical protein